MESLTGLVLFVVLVGGGIAVMLGRVRPGTVLLWVVLAALGTAFWHAAVAALGWAYWIVLPALGIFLGMRILQRGFRLWLGRSAGDQLTAQLAYDALRWLATLPLAAVRLIARFRG